MSLTDKVAGEQQAVANGTEACTATLNDMACVRVAHLPDDHVHVGQVDGQYLQWEDQ